MENDMLTFNEWLKDNELITHTETDVISWLTHCVEFLRNKLVEECIIDGHIR